MRPRLRPLSGLAGPGPSPGAPAAAAAAAATTLRLSLLLHSLVLVSALQESAPGWRHAVRGGDGWPGRRQLVEAFSAKTVVGAARTRKASDKCWSRTERHLYHQAMTNQSSPAFVERLRAYEKMHERCVMGVRDWSKFAFPSHPGQEQGLKQGANVTGCKYLLLQNFDAAGVGNQFLAVVSSFAYALLTDRAFVMEPATAAANLLCNPFAASHWAAGKSLDAFHTHMHKGGQSFARLGTWLADPNRTQRHLNVLLWYNYNGEDKQFFCEDVQKRVAPVTFLGFQADTYILPALHLVPALHEEMDRLFPDRQLFTHLARWLLHPSNLLWERITRYHQSYLAGHHETVGIQVRTFTANSSGTEERVLACARDIAAYLPPTAPFEAYEEALQQEGKERAAGRKIAAFVTSLQPEHAEFLRAAYSDGRPVDGSFVSVHTYSAEKKEKRRNLDHSSRAVMEIWLLSFCSKLLVSEHSTFGALAAGLAGVAPYVMNVGVREDVVRGDWRTDNRAACAPAGADPCFFTSPKVLKCGDVSRVDAEIVPYARRCPAIGYGLVITLAK